MKKHSESSPGGFCCIFRGIRNWWEKPCIFHVVKYTKRLESDRRNVPIRWGKNGYQFPRLSKLDGFHCIFPGYKKLMGKVMHFVYYKVYYRMWTYWEKITNTMGKVSTMIRHWWKKPCIFDVAKYTKRWESGRRKVPIRWGKNEYQFPRFFTYVGFCGIFPWIDFPHFSHLMGFTIFSSTMGNWWENPWISHVMKYNIRWECNGKNHPFYGKVMITNSPDLPRLMGFADFSNTTEIWGENPYVSHVTKYTSGWESNGKKCPYYGKRMNTNFPCSPHTMGFVEYYREPNSQTFPIW